MGTRGKRVGLNAQQLQQQRNSLPAVVEHNAATTRRVSFPLLPSHAMLGSQLSREASKSFWSQEMLRDLERRMPKEDSKLPPLQGSHVITAPSDNSRSRKSSYDRHQAAGLYLSTTPVSSSSSSYRTKIPSNNVPLVYRQAL